MDEFFLLALAAGTGVAVLAGPVGVFVVWRRMAYFGDTMAHSALLGVALGLLLGLNVSIGVVTVTALIAILLLRYEGRRRIASDTLLGILSHASLAAGLIAVSMQESARINVEAYLFGDILAVSVEDTMMIWGGAAILLGLLHRVWRPLLALSVHEELARVEGLPVARTRLAFMLLIALVVALGMKLVGALLITALLIIPAAAARPLSRTPEQMALYAALAGTLAVFIGLAGSWYWDAPAGPSVVVAAAALFALSAMLGSRRP